MEGEDGVCVSPHFCLRGHPVVFLSSYYLLFVSTFSQLKLSRSFDRLWWLTQPLCLRHIQYTASKNKMPEHVTETIEDVNKQQLPVCSREVSTFQESCTINLHLWHAFMRLLRLQTYNKFPTLRLLLLIAVRNEGNKTSVGSRRGTNRNSTAEAGNLINADVYLAMLVDILDKQLSEHGNDTQCRFPVTMLRKAVHQGHWGTQRPCSHSKRLIYHLNNVKM